MFPNFKTKTNQPAFLFIPRREKSIEAKQVENVSSIGYSLIHSAALWRVRINYLVTRLINPFQAPLFSYRVRWFCVGPAALPGPCLLHLLRSPPLFDKQRVESMKNIYAD